MFDGIAHPDSIKLFGHVPSFELNEFDVGFKFPELIRLIDEA